MESWFFALILFLCLILLEKLTSRRILLLTAVSALDMQLSSFSFFFFFSLPLEFNRYYLALLIASGVYPEWVSIGLSQYHTYGHGNVFLAFFFDLNFFKAHANQTCRNCLCFVS